MSDEAARKRYVRFDGVDLGVAPGESWGSLRRDLLEFEEHIACEQHDVGLVAEYPFALRLKRDVTVHQKPTPLPPDRRAWVNKETDKLMRSGVIKRVPTAKFTSKVVLVEEGQDGQDFRMCYNFIDLNQLTEEAKYIMKDTW